MIYRYNEDHHHHHHISSSLSSPLWSTLSYGGYFTGRKCVRILRFLKIVKDFEISKRYWNWARGGRGGYLFIFFSSRGRLPMRPNAQKSLWQEKDLWLVDRHAQCGAAMRARKTMVANGLWGKYWESGRKQSLTFCLKILQLRTKEKVYNYNHWWIAARSLWWIVGGTFSSQPWA